MLPKGVLGLGLGSGGKAFAGDWGLLKGVFTGVGKLMLGLRDVAEGPKFKPPMPLRGSI